MVKILPDTVNRIYLLLILLILISSPASGFSKSESFVNYTADMIYHDCNGKNIAISPGMIDYMTDSNTRKNLTLLEWPYSEELIRRILEIFSPAEFREPKFGPPFIDRRGNGSELIKCDTNKLDIFGTTWYWNGIEIMPPLKTDITNVNNTAINNQGNLVQGLENTNITQNQMNTEINNLALNLQESKKENFWLSYIYPPIQSLILSILGYLLINPKSTKKQRLINIIYYFVTILIVSFLIIYLFKLIV